MPELSDAHVEVDEQRTKQPAQCTCKAMQHSSTEVLVALSTCSDYKPPPWKARLTVPLSARQPG